MLIRLFDAPAGETLDRLPVAIQVRTILHPLGKRAIALDMIAREERWTLGDVDPETVDLEADSLADYRFAIAKPLPPLKTEFQTVRGIVPFKTTLARKRFRSSL